MADNISGGGGNGGCEKTFVDMRGSKTQAAARLRLGQ